MARQRTAERGGSGGVNSKKDLLYEDYEVRIVEPGTAAAASILYNSISFGVPASKDGGSSILIASQKSLPK